MLRSASTVVAAVLMVAACESSGSAPAVSIAEPPPSAAAAVSTVPSPNNLDVPPPFEMQQRIGLGERWEMIVTDQESTGGTLTVDVVLSNAGTDPGELSHLGDLFTVRSGLLGDDVPAAAAVPDRSEVGVGASLTVRISFDFVPSGEDPAVLFFHGSAIGALDATVTI